MAEKILLVEDEEKLARMVEMELRYEGYEVTKAFDGRSGLDQALSGKYDLVLLDIMLPQLSGMEVLRRLRRESDLPVIMLTARDSVIDKVSGLDSGADDYITKPFAIEELLARIRAALRKRSVHTGSILTAGDLVMDVERHQVSVRGQSVELTKKEFDLLHQLLENKGGCSPGRPCWTACGALTLWAKPTRWMYTSAFSAVRSMRPSASSSSTPCAAWAM